MTSPVRYSIGTGQAKLGYLSLPVLIYSCVFLLLGSLSPFHVSSHTAVKGIEVPHPLVLTQSVNKYISLYQCPHPGSWQARNLLGAS